MAAQAGAVMQFLNDEEIANPILIGHSLGGGVCLHLVDMASRAGTPITSKLVLLDPVAFPPVMIAPRLGFGDGPDLLFQSPARVVAKLVLARVYAPGNKPTEDQIEGYADGLTRRQLPALMQHILGLSTDQDLLPSFDRITNETLIVWGDQDRIVPLSDGEELSKKLQPHATLVTISNSGHIPHEEQPTATMKAISEFLQ
jgi:pimeloyl-ACP methyl ester carboxylesterase